ncbi:MAG: symmetrical bis(5'-nucleosyl)-tetraphosphatase [Deltaproteobacteria bacterium]|nr:symmetrical bis(5'-nucleosyl)-tetraphosphatase [Deltaproteobacteria bacterium]MCW5806477.1 symmetrical bis(5'-nucleosyl)-tetraphosphatase [Deltaproteobacteria bacterium]
MARYAIGDVQGCMASLERLLALIDFAPARDHLWFVGDLVNRGPRSLDVLRWAMDHDAVITCVLGNHDLHLLARAAGAAGEKKRDTLDEVLAAPDCDRLIDWLRCRPLLHLDPKYVLVHAGLHPQWTAPDARARAAEIERELRGPTWRAFLTQIHGSPPRWDARLGGGDRWRAILAYLVRARTCKLDGRVVPDFDGPPAQAPAGAVPWFALPARAWTTHTVVFGHWAALGLDIGAHHVGLDTGCVWGRSLTAIRLDDRMVFQVKAVETPAP